MKKCSKCGVEKPLTEFYKQRRLKDGHQGYCKECQKITRQRDWEKHRDKRVATMRRCRLRREYGMTVEEWDKLYEEQGNVCAICKQVPDIVHTDHCHTTGKVRGVLCDRCNHMIGHAKENPETLRAGIAYLEKHA